VINDGEAAARVRAIFALYLEHEALLPVLQELARRGWTNKRWTSRKGRDLGLKQARFPGPKGLRDQ
jgi:site-specific DNA recombinase